MTLEKATSRAWLEVNQNALIDNLENARLCLHGAKIIAVLKANAYGIGIVETACLLNSFGIDFFAVACVQEALQVKAAVNQSRILVMGNTAEAVIPDCIMNGIRMTAGSPSAARAICQCAEDMDRIAYVHFKLDTGMHRLGLYGPDTVRQIRCLSQNKWIYAEGLYSHLALRDTENDILQYACFNAVSSELKREGIGFKYLHLLDSIGMVRYPEWHMDAVRLGAYLYGNAPKGYGHPEKVKPVAAFKTRVVRIEDVKKGECIGYDDEHPINRDCIVATLSVGYADGYSRAASGTGEVEIRGGRAKVLGLVCMDQMMVDATEIKDLMEGDEAILFGSGISVREYASWGRLNQNECTAVIGRRVPRVYYRDNRVVSLHDELEDPVSSGLAHPVSAPTA